MGAHKTNMNITESRPRCETCPHYFRDGPKAGHCRAVPPTPFYLPQPKQVMTPQGLQTQMDMGLVSSHPPTQPDRWCGLHPGFLRWYSENRDAALDIGKLEAQIAEGAA